MFIWAHWKACSRLFISVN